MQHAKRIVSMVLALLMVLGTVGWIFSMVASAAMIDKSTITEIRDISGYLVYDYDSDDAKLKDTKNRVIKPGYTASFIVTYTQSCTSKEEAQKLVNKDLEFILETSDFAKGAGFGISLRSNPSVIEETDDSGKGTGSFLAQFVLNVKNVIYDGEGDGVIAIRIKEKGENPGFDETARRRISACEPLADDDYSYDDYEDDDGTRVDAATPYVIISGFDYGGSQISAGDTFTLNLTIKNTALHIDVSNMVITISPSESFTLVNSSNTFYISRLDAKGSINRSLQMQAKPSADPSAASIEIKLSYQYIDQTRKTVDRSESISIPIVQQERFSVSPPEDVATEIYVGEEADLSLDYMNKGRGTIYNVSASIQGENLQTPGQTDNVGNVESGKSGTFDFYVAGIEPGVVSGEVVVTYEDVNMNVKTISVPFSIKVNSMEMEAGGDMMGYVDENGNTVMPDGTVLGPDGMPIDPNASQGGNMLLFIGIGAGVLVAIIIVIVVARKKRKARLEAELAEDDDEDN